MREIRQHAQRTLSGSTHDKQQGITISKLKELSLLAHTPILPFAIKNAYDNKRDRTYQEKEVLRQCMNALGSPTETMPKKRRMQIKIRVAVRRTQRKKKDNNVFPTVVPGTLEQLDQNKTDKDQQGQSKDEDLTLYYKVFNRYKPEAGESNAESTARTAALEAEYQYLLMKKKKTTISNLNVRGQKQHGCTLCLRQATVNNKYTVGTRGRGRG